MTNTMNFILKNGKLTMLAFLLISSFFAIFIWTMAQKYYDSNNQKEFEDAATVSFNKIYSRLSRDADVLNTGVSFINASEHVTPEDWHNFVTGLDIEKNYPSMQGYGFSMMLNPDEVTPIEQRMRAEGQEDFTLKPVGIRDQYSTIVYLEPMSESNKKAIGYDMYSNPIRKVAMDFARDSGTPAFSGKVTLVQEITVDKQAGFLLYVPLYQNNTDKKSLIGRQKGLIGFVYAPFRMNDFIQHTQAHTDNVDLTIYDDSNMSNDSLMYKALKNPVNTPKHTFTKSLTLYNHTWTIIFSSSPKFDKENTDLYPLLVTAASLVIYIILLFIIFTLLKSKYLLQQQTDELHTLQKTLSESEFRWKFAVEGSGDGLWDWNIITSDVYFSPQWKKMLGFTEDEIHGSLDAWEKRVHPDDLERVFSDIQKHLTLETPLYGNEHRLLCKDGTYKWVLARGIVVERSAQGEAMRIIGTNTDISEQKKLSEELITAKEAAEASARGKSEFLAAMSHEIRTPMNGVLGMLGLLDKSKLDSTQKHYVHVATSSATSLLGLINDILDFSKIEAGKMDLEMLEFNLNNEFQDLVESLDYKAYEKGLKLTLDTTEVTHPNIITDPGRLRQILTNLVGNSIKFTHQGKIHITASLMCEDTTHGLLHIHISDTGIGITPDKIATLFDAFTQADGSTTRKYGGTGLGLSIVKRLCELMGGSINTTSVPGEGSTFSISLAVELGTNQVIAQKTRQESQTPLEQNITWPSDTRILLVEDNATNQIVAQGILEGIGLHCDIAANGLEALAAIKLSSKTLRYTIVLMDCQMPEMDGYDATRAIRAGKAGEENKQLPIIAMTANAMQGDREKCTDAGMDDYISKPINLSILKSTLIKWILKGEVSAPLSPGQSITEQTAPIDFPLWDEADTLKRLGNNKTLLNKIIESFMNDGLKSFAALRTALEENNSESAHLHAHSLKGSAGNVGALKLQECTKHLEEAAKNKNLNEVKAGLEECENILDETLALFKIYLAKNAEPIARVKRFDPLQMAIKLQSLKKDLENGMLIDTEGLGIFGAYSDEVFSANMKTLKEHIERFESDQAIVTLEGIMAGLE